MNYEDYIVAAEKVNKSFKDQQDVLARFPASFFYEKMMGYAKALFQKYAPFRVGDRVMLTETPEITAEKSWGWLGAKHFLVRGALGTVVSVDYSDNQFIAGTNWDDDSWVDPYTKEVKNLDQKSIYVFSEKYLKVVGLETPSTKERP